MLRKPQRRAERGQTIILVAISIVSLLGMAALAIDVVTLYVASSEIKRAADAAALAGAKGIADSGVTTLPQTDPNLPAAQTLAQNMASAAIAAMLPVNTVAGATPTLLASPIDWTRPGNPLITVGLERTGLPTFFAKIWGQTGSTVSASSTAEVYNPSNNPSYTPIAPTSVKPWLMANLDPTDSTPLPFISSTGQVETQVTNKTFNISADCKLSVGNACIPINPQPSATSGSYPVVQYMPALTNPSNGNNVCPTWCMGPTDYERSVECADVATSYVCGAGGASWDPSTNPQFGGVTSPSAAGAECLTHAATFGPLQGQDQLNDANFPNGPPQITAGSFDPLYAGTLVSTSSSIVTIPIIDPTSVSGSPPVTIVGFMQAFINYVQSGVITGSNPGDINITVLNIAGCNTSPNGSPSVVGGTGTSPVPVRLIAPPTNP